jgi:hypothetical protein
MFVRPVPGVKVRDPYTRLHIPETGIEVSETDTFWARRLADGDVVPAERPVPQSTQSEESAR